MTNIYEFIEDHFKYLPDVLFGITNIDFSHYNADYKCALVVAVPHSKRLGSEEYAEEVFAALIDEARERSVKIMNEIAWILEQNGIRYYTPTPAQTSEIELIAPFSYKYAAVNAGLGWIGKNDVLITEKYGPEVTLYAILIDHDLPVGKPSVESKCPPDCDLCSRACPHNALPGMQWCRDSKRLELIDYQLCNQIRSLYKSKHDRKHSCGLCMVACPIGLAENVYQLKKGEDDFYVTR